MIYIYIRIIELIKPSMVLFWRRPGCLQSFPAQKTVTGPLLKSCTRIS